MADISNSTADSLVTGTDSDDYIINYDGDRATLSGGKGNDTISNNYSWNVSMSGGEGTDILMNINSRYVTLNGGKGYDLIYLVEDTSDNLIVYNDGDGNDNIDGFSYEGELADIPANTTISVASGTYSTMTSGQDLLIKVGEGVMTVHGVTSLPSVTILGTEDTAPAGVTISNNTANTLVTGTTNGDLISNTGADRVTIDGGAGVDSIVNTNSWNSSVFGGEGDDVLINRNSRNVTLNGGKGNDEILLLTDTSDNLIVYNEGDGNDLVRGYDNDAEEFVGIGRKTTLQIGGGSGTYSSTKSGDDVIVKVGEGQITLKGAATLLALNIIGEESVDGITLSNNSTGSLVTGSDGSDFINNYNGDRSTLDGGKGNDTLVNTSSYNVSLAGGAGNDEFLVQDSRYVTVNGGAGDDKIGLKNDTANNLIVYNAGDGDDVINGLDDNYNVTGIGATTSLSIAGGTYSTEKSDDGKDVIVKVGNGRITLTGGVSLGKSFLTNNIIGSYSGGGEDQKLVYLSEYDDTYTNNTDEAMIYALGGDDYIINRADSVTVDGGTGDDEILTAMSVYNSISGGEGDDSITNAGQYNTLDGGAGNDYIMNLVALVFDANGNVNSLASAASYVTVNGGDGNDDIHNYGAEATINGGAGNDYIENNGAYIIDDGDELQFQPIGTDLLIDGGDGSDTIRNENSLANATIRGGAGQDTIVSKSTSALLEGGAHADFIVNSGDNSTLLGGDGNDNVVNHGGDWVTMSGGAGDDWIAADLLDYNIASESDRLQYDNKHVLILYSPGDGNDTVRGFDTNSSLQIGDGKATYSKTVSGADVLLTVGNSVISLVSAASLSAPNFIGTEILSLTNSNKAAITLGAGVDFVTAAKRTKATRIVGNALNNSIVGSSAGDTLNGGKGNDTLTGGKGSDVFVYKKGTGNDVITDYAEEDIISITSGTADEVVTSGKNVIFKVGSNRITVKGAAEKIITYFDTGGQHYYPVPVSVNAAGTAATLLSSYSGDTFDVASNRYVSDYAGTLKTINASAVVHDLSITGNKLANRIIGSEEDDLIDGGAGKDTILGGDGNDTLIGGTGNDNLTGGDGADVFVYNTGDGNDLITDYDEEDKLRINGAISKIATTKGGVVVFQVDGGKVSVKGGASKVVSYEDSDGKQYFYPVTFNAAGTAATLLAEYTKDSFDVAKYGDYAGTVKTVNASAVTHDLTITGNKLANKILGGNGNDTLIGGKGNDSLNGGKGSDVFVYNSGDGNDTIASYTQGEDRIQIASGTVSKVSVSGSNVIFTVGTGKLVVKGGTEQLITYVDADGKEHFYPDEVKFNDKGTSATILSSYHKSAFKISDYGSYGTTVQTINAAAVDHNISVTANSKANTIYGSTNNDYIDGGAAKDVLYGGEGNDTLRGGTGNDTLWGGDGADVFLYSSGDGNDVIADYAKGEKISVTGAAVDKATVSGDNVVLTVGAGKITVKDAAKNNTPVTYYVDGKKKTYKPASSDLLIDDNYSADAAQLTNIVEPFKASYTPYDFDNGLDLTRNEKLSPVFLTAKS